ncbi:MAG TPA: hypothetical protein VGO93_09160 [Candidatus Xenobia bacterium]|jgi:hypothetical protein
MRVTEQDPSIRTVSLPNLVRYLHRTGWVRMQVRNAACVAFEKTVPWADAPFNIALPIDSGYSDTWERVASAINVLSTVEDVDPADVLGRIAAVAADGGRTQVHAVPSDVTCADRRCRSQAVDWLAPEVWQELLRARGISEDDIPVVGPEESPQACRNCGAAWVCCIDISSHRRLRFYPVFGWSDGVFKQIPRLERSIPMAPLQAHGT